MREEWKRLTEEPIKDLRVTILSDIEKNKDEELSFYVGCDSQNHKGYTVFIKAITMIKKGHGGLCYYSRDRVHGKRKQMRDRLWDETLRTIEIAKMVDGILIPAGHMIEAVHLDLNPDDKHLSNCVVAECLGYIRAMGYSGVLKPDSWVASKLADRKTK